MEDQDENTQGTSTIYQNEKISDEVQEIITSVPKWILRWGITLIFSVVFGIVLLSALIQYPDIVKTTLKVNSLNSPKPVLAKQNGKLIRLLVKDGEVVKKNQTLAFFESTASHEDVLRLNIVLKNFQNNLLNLVENQSALPTGLNLGELQGSYQSFYQQYLQYQSTQKNGYYLKKMRYLSKDLEGIRKLKAQILRQQSVQQKEYINQQQEYDAYQKLYKDKVISRSEFIQQENTYLNAKYPLQQTETALVNNETTYAAKEKELLDIRHTIAEEQAKFIQSLNQCITDSDSWIQKYVLDAPFAGRVSFAGIVQQNQNFLVNQEVFVINPGNTDFFGELQIPQNNMGKIRVGEETLVKLRSYPYEQFGMIRGKLTYISDAAYKDSVFIAKVSFNKYENKDPQRQVQLKNGMLADAEIITEETSLLRRLLRNMNKMVE
ncbi:HlyD family secretion protein [Pedobacter sp. AW1-32]|uniref:HlyD family secretion protein n=1 Tax=Pedobacter sp. AW1-32 TaxID=3383026 RepID=UPI003FEEC2C7